MPPDITDADFDVQGRLANLFEKKTGYTPLGAANTCSGRRGTPTFGQAVVHEICKVLAADANANRGLVVLHSTGSGKTCAAVAAMDAFMGAKRSIFYVTTVAARRANPPEQFAACASDLFTKITPDFVKSRVVFTTFAKFAHIFTNPTSADNVAYTKRLARSLVIIDEVHNLFHPLPAQRAEHERILRFFTTGGADYDIKYVIMTATPGDNPAELVQLLNIVADRRRPAIKVPDFTSGRSVAAFARSIVGLVSYVDLANDEYSFPKVTESVVNTQMGQAQFATYAEQVVKSAATADAVYNEEQAGRYWIQARKYANTLFTYDPATELHEFSSKLPLLLERVLRAPAEKHYVYSAFGEKHGFGGHGIVAIAKLLTSVYGYKQLTVEEARKGALQPRPRFALMCASELRGTSSSEAVEQGNVDAIRRVFNDDANVKGELLHVILASQNYNEGIDLKAVRHLHFLEPLVTYNQERQTIGRAVRHCSHSQLRKEYGEWTVKIHRYFSTAPPIKATFVDIDNVRQRIDAVTTIMTHTQDVDTLREQKQELEHLQADLLEAEAALNETHETIDHKIYAEARERYKDMALMQLAVASAAVDCKLTRDFHGLRVPCLGGARQRKP